MSRWRTVGEHILTGIGILCLIALVVGFLALQVWHFDQQDEEGKRNTLIRNGNDLIIQSSP